jgi:hypothetical protein
MLFGAKMKFYVLRLIICLPKHNVYVNVCIVFIENIFLLICLFFMILLLSTVYCMRFLNKNSNKTVA